MSTALRDPRTGVKWLRVSYVAYCLSLVAPAYVIDYYSKPMFEFGGMVLLFGPVGLFAGHYSWLANVFIWDAWLSLKKGKPGLATFMSLTAIPIALTFLLGKEVPAGSAGNFGYKAHIGYYLWLVSMALTVAASTVEFVKCRSHAKSGRV